VLESAKDIAMITVSEGDRWLILRPLDPTAPKQPNHCISCSCFSAPKLRQKTLFLDEIWGDAGQCIDAYADEAMLQNKLGSVACIVSVAFAGAL